MRTKLSAWLFPPTVGDDDESQLARPLSLILSALLGAAVLTAVIMLMSGLIWQLVALGVATAVVALALWLTRRGQVRWASFLVLLDMAALATYLLYIADGLQDVAVLIYPVLLLVASLLLRQRLFLIMVGVVMAALAFITYGQVTGQVTNLKLDPNSIYSDLVFAYIILSLTALAAHLLAGNVRQNLQRAWRNERALAESNQQLTQQAERLQASEARWRSLIENAPDLILHVQRNGFIVFTNSPGAEAGMAGRPIYDYLRPADHAAAQQFIETVFTTRQATAVELPVRLDPDHYRWFAARVGPILHEGQVVGLTVIASDVTARKEAEAHIRALNAELEQRVQVRTAELESANRELEALAYTIAHDLRIPARAMHGFAHLLKETSAESLNAGALRHLNRILENAQRMGQLVDDLLTFMRLGRERVRPQTVDMQALVTQIVEELRPQLGNRAVDIQLNPLPAARADLGLMRQVWFQLLTNALKFTEPRSSASVEIGVGELDAQPYYYVRDNGVGFDMQYLDKLFGAFQRLHHQDEFEGTGMGLAIVKRILQRHGGRVWAEAEPDNGATFYFTLPESNEHPPTKNKEVLR